MNLRLLIPALVLATACSANLGNPPAAADAAVDGVAVDGGPSDGGSTLSDSGTTPDVAPIVDNCVPKSGDPLLVRLRGTVFTGFEVIPDGEVFVSAITRRILCVGQDCSQTEGADKATVLCTGGVITPGLINPHDHGNYNHLPRWDHGQKLYKNRYQWQADPDYQEFKKPQQATFAKAKCEVMKWAELRGLIAGTTSMQGGSGSACINGWVRDLDEAVGASGISGYTIDTQVTKISGAKAADVSKWLSGLKNGGLSALVLHVGEGVDDASRKEWTSLVELGLAQSRVALIHAAGLTGVELAEARLKDVRIIWSPQSNLDLYGDTTRVPAALRLGMTVSLGPDWTPSGSMSPLEEMKCAKQLSDKRWGGLLTDEMLVRMVTVDAAKTMGAEKFIGALAPGLFADVAVFAGDRNKPFAAVVASRPETVRLVMVGGRPLYGDSELVSAILPPHCEAFEACGAAKMLCVQDPNVDKGDQSLATLKDALTAVLNAAKAIENPPSSMAYAYGLWPLLTCGAEADKLIRCDVKGAAPSSDDSDGDGHGNGDDVCPTVWDPDQGDLDKDGQGDACDVCPLKTGTDCPKPQPGDQDGDGLGDGKDNCPIIVNEDQQDGDSDGLGDVCDPCPDKPNPNGQSCPPLPAEVTAVNQDATTWPDGTLVELKGMVATAGLSAKGSTPAQVWLQVMPGQPWGGILAQLATGQKPPAVGQPVSVVGRVATLFGLKALQDAKWTSTGAVKPPVPLVVDVDVLSSSAKVAPYRSLLVELPNAKVAKQNADEASGKDYGEVLLEGGLRVDDLLVTWGKDGVVRPEAGQIFAKLRGVVYLSYNQNKLLPRSAADFGVSP